MERAKSPTQADVARLAGVSQTTVSLIINELEGAPAPVAEETRQRVLRAIEELSYFPNARARSLSKGRSGIIGLLIPDSYNPFFWEVVRGVESEAYRREYGIIVTSTGLNADREEYCLRLINQRHTDGFIFLPTFGERVRDELRSLRDRGHPLVLLGTDVVREVDLVMPDNYVGAREALAHLLDLGHHRIAFIHAVARPELGQERLQAYREGIHNAGLTIDESLIHHCGPTFEEGYLATQRLLNLPSPPTAIFAVNDYIAISSLQAIYSQGLRVPADISVIGFDNIEQSRHMWPPLTTVNINGEQAGRAAAQLLFERIEDPDRPPQTLNIDSSLIVRASTAPPPEKRR